MKPRVLTNRHRLVAACPACGELCELRYSKWRDLFIGKCRHCAVDIWTTTEHVREKIGDDVDEFHRRSELHRVIRACARLWAGAR